MAKAYAKGVMGVLEEAVSEGEMEDVGRHAERVRSPSLGNLAVLRPADQPP